MIRLFFFFCFSFAAFSQKTTLPLPVNLNELSGLVFINDSILVGHNDGGDLPQLYFLNKAGQLLHTCAVSNAKNIDWEDICYDGKKYLYIGDIGNNNNNRKDLTIFQVNAQMALNHAEVESKSFQFIYPEQKAFPEEPKNRHFDAEALTFYNNQLYIFTKCRAEPWDGLSFVYQLSTDMVTQKAVALSPLYIGKTGWWQDAVTGADIQGNLCYILTYNRLIVYEINGATMKFIGRTYLDPITQKEAIAVNRLGEIIVGDEMSKMIGGGFLYLIENKWKK
ncbi:MAG: hypothetical protein KJ941_09235 [Bacteroidetes bacterium]|nr:hypothetical protein [Bacteroidota bacterium]